MLLQAYRLSEWEAEHLKHPKPGDVEEFMSRRDKGQTVEYEVHWYGTNDKANTYVTREALAEKGWGQLCKQFDVKWAAQEAGMDLRPVTTREVQAHLDDFGLEKEFGTFGKIRGLSGGQKVKLVLAAAMWNQPHLLVLDEPTNYLDRDGA